MRVVGLAAVLVLAAGAAEARRPANRLHLTLDRVTATPSAPAEVSDKARQLFLDLVAARPRLSATGGSGVRVIAVTLNVDEFERRLAPSTAPGASGRVLTIRIGVKLVGTTQPSGVLALAGSGRGTVMTDVGERIRPREEEQAVDAALNEAVTYALDEAIARLQAEQSKKKPARKR